MLHKILSISISGICGITLAMVIGTLPLIAYQRQMATNGSIGASIHLDPNENPRAGHASLTWFRLTGRGGNVIPSANCDCRVAVFDANDEAIAHHLSLTTLSRDGHEAMGTTITFPTAGSYTVVLVGEAEDDSFEPFEVEFPVVVNP